jgi:alpha-ketoglutarate-dependent taurine dioxygenase
MLILLLLLNIVTSYKFSTPYKVNWVGQFEDINILNNLNVCKNAFSKIPILIFKNQKITNSEFYNIVSLFDTSDTKKENIIHPYQRETDNLHIGICNNLKSHSIDFNNVWHMDNIGKDYLPNVVSSLYFQKVPDIGGETIFANLLNAYAKINYNDRIDINNLISIYAKSDINIGNNIYAPNGFRRLNKIITQDSNIIKYPFVYYPNIDYSLKSFLFSPIRFIKFEHHSEEQSWDILDHIFIKYINTPDNTVSIKWDTNDLVIFNNRLLLHTSTPTEIYNQQDRYFKVIFLNTLQKIS